MLPSPSKLYLDASGWGYGDARYAAYFMPQKSFVDMTKATGEVSVFEVAVPANQTQVIFVRMNGGTTENNWDNKWNQTGDLDIPTNGSNKFTPSGWDGATTTWSTYTYTPPTFYIAGDFVTPTWSENAAANKMDYADGVFSKSYDNVAASAHQFKITNGTWTNAIGYDQNKCSGTNCTVENGGGNIQFTPLTEGTVTITYTLEDGKVHITCPEPPAVEYNITYPATQTNYTLVAGPAKAQTGAEVSFTATPAEGYVLNVTYNGNVIAGNNNVYTFMMPATDVTVAITAVAATTLYYVDNNNWGNVNAYMWSDNGNNGSWPGAAMALVGTVGDKAYSYYSISFAQGAYTSIIFNGGGSQTADLTINTAEPYFYDGEWYTWDDLLAELAAPVVTYDYYVIGTVNGWALKDANFGMTDDNADGVYEKEVTLTANNKHELKINNGSWDDDTQIFGFDQLNVAYEGVSRGSGDGDNNVVIELTEDKTITVKFDKNAKKITLDGLTESTAPTKYYVKGSHNAWTADATSEMTLDGDVYKKEVTLAKDVEFKINDGASGWWGANNLGGKAYKELEATDNLKMKEAKTFTIIFNPSENLITFEGLTEETPVVEDFSNQPSILYFRPNTNWKDADARFAAYFFGTEAKWLDMTDSDSDGIYEVANDKTNANVIFCRMNPSAAENKWENKWNQTCDIVIPNEAENLNTVWTPWKNVFEEREDDKKLYGIWAVPETIGSGDNTAFYNKYNGETINVIVERTFTDVLHTLCLPFSLPANWIGTAYQLSGVQSNNAEELVLYVKECNTFEAGKPYIVEPTNDELASKEYLLVDNVTISTTLTPNSVSNQTHVVTLKGILNGSGQTDGAKEYYIGTDGALHKEATNKLALRSIVEITDKSGNPVGVRARVAFNENVETGVEDIIATDAPVKVIVNGQLIIIRDGVKYNVQGQKL